MKELILSEVWNYVFKELPTLILTFSLPDHRAQTDGPQREVLRMKEESRRIIQKTKSRRITSTRYEHFKRKIVLLS